MIPTYDELTELLRESLNDYHHSLDEGYDEAIGPLKPRIEAALKRIEGCTCPSRLSTCAVCEALFAEFATDWTGRRRSNA